MSTPASALPASMRARKERMLAQLGTTDTPADDPAPPALAPVDDTPVDDTPPPASGNTHTHALDDGGAPSEGTDWKAEFEKSEQRYRSLQGMIASKQTENEKLRDDFGKMQETIDKLQQDLHHKRIADKITPVDLDSIPDLTEDEARVYAESAPVIAKLSRKEAAAVVKQVIQPLVQELAELKKGQKEVGDRSTNTEEALFTDAVKRAVPDMAGKVKHPEWGEFLSKKAPFSRATYRELLQTAHYARDLDTVVEIFSGFRPASLGTGSGLSAPPATGAARQPGRPEAKPTLRLSERRKISEDYRMGRISYAELQKHQKRFAEAEAEGRLDFNS